MCDFTTPIEATPVGDVETMAARQVSLVILTAGRAPPAVTADSLDLPLRLC